MNKNCGLLLDRDGVINRDTNFVDSVERFEFLPGIFPFLRSAIAAGYRLAVLTNQSGIARGLFSIDDYNHINAHMLATLSREGIHINLTLASFAHPEGTLKEWARESYWRKPNPGMVLEAVRRLNLNPTTSAFLGDNLRDMYAGQRGGIGKCLWLTEQTNGAPADITIVANYAAALKALSA